MKTFAANNGRFKILTDTGFSDFIGVTKSIGNFNMVEIHTENNSIYRLTEDHGVYINEYNSVCAGTLNENDIVFNSTIQSINKYASDEHVYDVLHVTNNNRFYIKYNETNLLVDNCLYIDEFGFLPNAEELYESVYPTISSSDKTKVIITSTPKGLNYFYKMWVDAEEGRSAYVPYDVKWYEHPDRDQNWYNTMCSNMNAMSIEQEVNCVGGSTLIDVNGELIEIEKLYNDYSQFNNVSNSIVYFNGVELKKRK